MPNNIWKNFDHPNYAIRHPIRAMKTFFRVFKWAWQRTTKGYADIDMWGMNEYLTTIIPDMLSDMADTAHGYPCCFGDEESNSAVRIRNIHEWKAYLHEMAGHFRNTSESQTIQVNEFDDEFFNACVHECKENSDGIVTAKMNVPDEIYKKYCDREKEIFAWQEKERDLAFDMLKPVWFTLWD